MKTPIIYIVTNKKHGILYTGVTSDIAKRIYEHKTQATKGFTAQYNCKMLVFYEIHETMESAIAREKQLKAGSRKKKLQLIEAMNPNWQDLYNTVL